MAKVTLPLLGVAASGTVGDAVTFGRWKGVNYARQRVVPSNPKTTAQTAQRELFAWTVRAWQLLPAAGQNAFINAASGTGITGFNLFSKRNLLVLRGAANAQGFVASPGQSGATNLASVSASGGAGTISWSATLADGIPGTTVTAVHVIAFRDGVPSGYTVSAMFSGSDTSSPYSGSVAVTAGSGTYVVCAFTECVDAAGKTKYGVSLNTTATVS